MAKEQDGAPSGSSSGMPSNGRSEQRSSGGAESSQSTPRDSEMRSYLLGLARGFGAAIIFSIPMLMTMELWWLGFYMGRLRLALFALLMFPLLIALGYFAGLRPTTGLTEETLDAATAYGIGLVAAATVLVLFGVIDFGMAPREIIGKIVILGVVASFGSMLGRSQLGSQADKSEEEKKKQKTGYIGQLFLELAGAMYLALNVAATVEMIKISYIMSAWHAIALVIVSVALLHAFIYALRFRGAVQTQATPWWSLFTRYTLPGYVLALGVAAYLLWTFGRFEDANLHWMIMYSVALGFPASVGAAAGRLLL